MSWMNWCNCNNLGVALTAQDYWFRLHLEASWCEIILTSLTLSVVARAGRDQTLIMHSPPVGRGRCDGGRCLDLGGEERLHQPSLLQDVRCLRLHTGPGWSHCHGNRRAGLLCHIQGAEEATASGKRSRYAAHSASVKIRVKNKMQNSLLS